MTAGGRAVIWGLIAISAAIEAALILGDAGFWGGPRLRSSVYDYTGFWPGLLTGGWQPNYPLQAVVMFFSYGFVHAGPGHLAMNMITLWSLGRAVAARIGGLGLALLYGGAILGGAVGYQLLAPNARPMVGASGALFGLAGAILAWAWDARQTGPVLRVGLFLVAINLVMWWALDGRLAWQTHLGGFVAGWLLAGPLARWRAPIR